MESPQYKVTYAVLLWCAACMARAVSAYSSQLHEPVEPHTVSYSTNALKPYGSSTVCCKG